MKYVEIIKTITLVEIYGKWTDKDVMTSYEDYKEPFPVDVVMLASGEPLLLDKAYIYPYSCPADVHDKAWLQAYGKSIAVNMPVKEPLGGHKAFCAKIKPIESVSGEIYFKVIWGAK